jgi:hypothetical protein
MVFRMREREDGNFELALDEEGINYLEGGLTELRRMQSGEALVGAPTFAKEGTSQFLLKREEG